MNEQEFEDILTKYPELIEEQLIYVGRQLRFGHNITDLVFTDFEQVTLIVEVKINVLKNVDTIIGQVTRYRNAHPSDYIRIMVVATKIDHRAREILMQNDIETKEITIQDLERFLKRRKNNSLAEVFNQKKSQLNNTHQVQNKIAMQKNNLSQEFKKQVDQGKNTPLGNIIKQGTSTFEVIIPNHENREVEFNIATLEYYLEFEQMLLNINPRWYSHKNFKNVWFNKNNTFRVEDYQQSLFVKGFWKREPRFWIWLPYNFHKIIPHNQTPSPDINQRNIIIGELNGLQFKYYFANIDKSPYIITDIYIKNYSIKDFRMLEDSIREYGLWNS